MSRRLMLRNANSGGYANGFVENDSGHGSTVYTVDSEGNIHVTTFNVGVDNSILLNFKKAILVNSGDIIEVGFRLISGRPPGSSCRYTIGSIQLPIYDSIRVVMGNTYSVTASSTNSLQDFSITNNSANNTYNFTFQIDVYINGNKII